MDLSKIRDPVVRQMLIERGVSSGLTYPSTSREFHQEQAILDQVMQQRAHQQEFEQQQAARQQAHEDTMAARGVAQDQLKTYREGLAQSRESAGEDRRTAAAERLLANTSNMDTLLGTKGAGTAVSKALIEKQLRDSGIGPITLPADAAKTALAQASGGRIPIPQPTVIGGAAPSTTAPNVGGGQQAALPYAAPQDLSPPPGSSPGAFERAFDLQQAVNRGEATTGGAPRGPTQAPGAAAHFDPNIGANVATFSDNTQRVVGEPDSSIGALRGSIVSADTSRPGGVSIQTPSGGHIGGTSKFAPSELATRIGGTPAPGLNTPPGEQMAAQPVTNFSPSTLAGAPSRGPLLNPQPNATSVPSATTTHIAGPSVQPQGTPQRELVPADYIAHYLGKTAGAVGGAPPLKSIGQGMLPSVFGFPPGTPGAGAVQAKNQPVKKPTPEELRLAGQR